MRFEIEDTGVGVAPEHRARIFEAFEQVGDASARREGTGLGLSITKKVVEKMGGAIEVESQLGQGSTFVVTLRLHEASSAAGVEPTFEWKRVVGYSGERRAILVVDNERDNRALLYDLLGPLGFEILEAQDGEEALQRASERRPAAIVMDLAMPRMDGFEAARRLRQMPEMRQVVIVASSASVSQEQRQKSKDAGCDDFVPKPVQANVLLERLGLLLGLTWVAEPTPQDAGPAAPPADAVLVAPPAESLAVLLDLVARGRIPSLLEALHRFQEQTPQAGPWLQHARVLAREFNLQGLREFLQSYAHADEPRSLQS